MVLCLSIKITEISGIKHDFLRNFNPGIQVPYPISQFLFHHPPRLNSVELICKNTDVSRS